MAIAVPVVAAGSYRGRQAAADQRPAVPPAHVRPLRRRHQGLPRSHEVPRDDVERGHASSSPSQPLPAAGRPEARGVCALCRVTTRPRARDQQPRRGLPAVPRSQLHARRRGVQPHPRHLAQELRGDLPRPPGTCRPQAARRLGGIRPRDRPPAIRPAGRLPREQLPQVPLHRDLCRHRRAERQVRHDVQKLRRRAHAHTGPRAPVHGGGLGGLPEGAHALPGRGDRRLRTEAALRAVRRRETRRGGRRGLADRPSHRPGGLPRLHEPHRRTAVGVLHAQLQARFRVPPPARPGDRQHVDLRRAGDRLGASRRSSASGPCPPS